jgi:hypothetical protein
MGLRWGPTIGACRWFPATIGPDLDFNGGTWDAFVAKVAADGTQLDCAGYIGGGAEDSASGIALDTAGNAYVTGTTLSSENDGFPLFLGPSLVHSGGSDAFVTRVTADGSWLDYSGYIGGSGSDSAGGIAVDSYGNAYVMGTTTSDEYTFPVAVGPDLTFNSYPPSQWRPDAFVAKVAHMGGVADVYLERLRSPRSLYLRKGRAAQRRLMAFGGGDTLPQDATVRDLPRCAERVGGRRDARHRNGASDPGRAPHALRI